jgi:broad specificity phosphatase PhoE
LSTAGASERGSRRLYLVRHGLPDYRVQQPGDEPPGPPLSAIGFDQARQAAGALRGFPVTRICCSPLMRTMQTAETLGRCLGLPVQRDGDLREWHRTESLHEVTVRMTRWLTRWLRGAEPCAAVVSHASPLLALLRSALYLPHVGWHKPGAPNVLELSSGERFEVVMACVIELVFAADVVAARFLFAPEPRIHHVLGGAACARLPRPIAGACENRSVVRPNWLRIIGGAETAEAPRGTDPGGAESAASAPV